jgi:hypothetical protein
MEELEKKNRKVKKDQQKSQSKYFSKINMNYAYLQELPW